MILAAPLVVIAGAGAFWAFKAKKYLNEKEYPIQFRGERHGDPFHGPADAQSDSISTLDVSGYRQRVSRGR